MTKARIPTAAAIITPIEAKFNAVKVFVKRVVLVALPSVPRSIPSATVCRFAAMIKAIRTTTINASMSQGRSHVMSWLLRLRSSLFDFPPSFSAYLSYATITFYSKKFKRIYVVKKSLSSQEEVNEPIMRGRGYSRHKKMGRPIGSVTLERKVRNGGNQAIISIPMTFLEQLGIMSDFLNGELYTEPLEINFLAREIKIKFPKHSAK